MHSLLLPSSTYKSIILALGHLAVVFYVLLFQDVEVKIRSSHVLVKVKGQTLVNDELLNRCDPEMSRWEIRGTRLVLVLQKEAGSTIPWPNVFVKDCKTHFDLSDVL